MQLPKDFEDEFELSRTETEMLSAGVATVADTIVSPLLCEIYKCNYLYLHPYLLLIFLMTKHLMPNFNTFSLKFRVT